MLGGIAKYTIMEPLGFPVLRAWDSGKTAYLINPVVGGFEESTFGLVGGLSGPAGRLNSYSGIYLLVEPS